ncbi:MAG TPA: ribonuclease P protein component [Fimbriimonadaceae bacterium]|nr:ribonuclease P protein component [Fimbriimonadaceae bacterium]
MNGPGKRRFDEIFDKGKRVQGKFTRLCALPGTGKIGFAVSKKIGCHARRNQIRRRYQAALREIGPRTERPLDLVVIIGTGASSVGIAEVRMDLWPLLKKIEERWASESASS